MFQVKKPVSNASKVWGISNVGGILVNNFQSHTIPVKLHCLGTSNHSYLQKPNWFVTSKVMICYLYIYLQPKNHIVFGHFSHGVNFTMQLVLEIFGFKETYWLGIFWEIYKEPDSRQKCSFCNIKKHIMIIILSQKTLKPMDWIFSKNHRSSHLGVLLNQKNYLSYIWEKVFNDL